MINSVARELLYPFPLSILYVFFFSLSSSKRTPESFAYLLWIHKACPHPQSQSAPCHYISWADTVHAALSLCDGGKNLKQHHSFYQDNGKNAMRTALLRPLLLCNQWDEPAAFTQQNSGSGGSWKLALLCSHCPSAAGQAREVHSPSQNHRPLPKTSTLLPTHFQISRTTSSEFWEHSIFHPDKKEINISPKDSFSQLGLFSLGITNILVL